jgi:hypothetical protein
MTDDLIELLPRFNNTELMEKEDENILKSIISKIIDDEKEYSKDLECEISKEILDYLNRNSEMRKTVPFITYENFETVDSDVDNYYYTHTGFCESEFKLGCRSMIFLVDILNGIIRSENEFIINSLVNHAIKNGLMKNMEMKDYNEIMDFIINTPGSDMIADKVFRMSMVAYEGTDEDRKILDDMNCCFLDEATGYIILVNNLENLFKVFVSNRLMRFFYDSEVNQDTIQFFISTSVSILNKNIVSVIKVKMD